MKRNDLKEVKTLEIKEIRARITKAKQEVADLTLEKNMKTLKNIKGVTNKRKDLAQMMTILRQKLLLEEIESRVKRSSDEKSESADQRTSEPVIEVKKTKPNKRKEKTS